MQEESNENTELDESLFAIDEDSPAVEGPQDTSEAETVQEPEAVIPDKYKNKSASEIIRMHQDAERLIGKQGNEVGELRKMVDDILHAQTSNPAPQEPELDFFENPQEAVARAASSALSNDPRLKALESNLLQNEQTRAAQALQARHPDVTEVMNDPAFGEWVAKSKLRTKMLTEANQNYDSDTASEVLDLWKESKSYVAQVEAAAQANRPEAVKKASTGSGKASAETRGKPILSREALVELKRTNPDGYYAKIGQIKQAYIEGRVR